MGEIVRRLVWFAVMACAFSYASLLLVGAVIELIAPVSESPILVRDTISPGTHRLTGMVMVPASCDQLSMHVEQMSTTTYQLMFQTWEDPAINCIKDPVPRSFQSIVFAPALGIRFYALLDGAYLPIAVIPEPIRQ